MFTIIKRYIGKTIIVSTLLTAAIIISVLFVVTLLGELKEIGQGDYGFMEALGYVIFRLPNDIYQFSPMLILIGTIIGLSVLSSHKELVVMRTSGFSIRKMMVTTLGAALCMILVITVVGEWFAPKLNHQAEINKENDKHAGQAVVTSSGVWIHVDDNFIHVREVIGRDLLEDVTRYQFDNKHRLKVAYYAKTLTLEDKQWYMNNGVKTEFYENRTRSQSFKKTPWDLAFNSNLLNIGKLNPNEMSLPRLLAFSKYLVKNGLEASEYQYSFWQRIFQPFASLIMILLALPFVLSVMSTAAMGWRIVAGILIGFGFYIFNALLGQLCIVYQLPTMLAALLPLIVFSVFGIYLSKKMIRG